MVDDPTRAGVQAEDCRRSHSPEEGLAARRGADATEPWPPSLLSDATAPQDESVPNENDQLQLQESAVQTNTVTFNSNNVFNNAETVSVKLTRYLFNKTEISLAIKGKYLINNSIEITEGNDYSIKVENGTYLSLYVNDSKVQTFQNSFLISPIQYGTNNYAIINGREYLGNIEFTVEDSKYIRPINTLPIEDYLKGVVPGEMPASWGKRYRSS